MDGPIEKLVVRKRDLADKLSIVLVVFLAVVIILALIIIGYYFEYFPIIAAVILFLAMKFVFMKNIEFEYSYFDGEIEFDKIINQKKRKSIAKLSVRDFETFGHQDLFSKIPTPPKSQIFCTAQENSSENYFFITNFNSKRTAFFFVPEGEIINDIKRRIPNKILKGE
ncbi:MAG: hypothetical protein WCQ41_05355 [Bacillota bacterium]